ncbi:hypothetical protein Tco_1321415 [Tanacetum coccineum]
MAARGQNQGNGKNKLAYAPKPKISPPPKREDPAKDSIYHECGETGHWKRNYPQYLAKLLKKKKNAASGAGGSGIFTIELNTFLNRSWIYDTGCGTHICNTTHGLRASRKLKSGSTCEYMSQEFLEHLKDHGIIAHRTLPYTSQHNVWWSPRRSIEIIQEEDTHPSIDTSLNHEEDNLEMDEPQSDIIPIRRSTRTRRPTNRMCLYIDAEEHELGDLDEPANYKAALLDLESDK